MKLIAYAVATLSYLVAIIYSTVFLKKNHRPMYFKCAFYGLMPMFLSGLYYLALMNTDKMYISFSLGVLGEVAAYLFVTTANSDLIPKEEKEQKTHISAVGLIFSLILAVILFIPVILNFSVPKLITSLLYAVSISPCLYYSVDVCINPYDNPFKAAVKPFNILIIIHIVGTALFYLTSLGLFGSFENVILIICTMAFAVPGFSAMALLKKGLTPWEI